MLYPALRLYACTFVASLLLQGHASALVLDWDSVIWADGTLNNSYQVDPVDPESSITIDVTSNNGANLAPYSVSPNPLTPTINSDFQGGLLFAEKTLVLAVDLANPTQSITVTVSFASTEGASNVSFKLFDIDAGGGSQDELSLIRALSIDGLTLIAPTITTSPDNTRIGTGINQSVVGTALTPSAGLTSGRGNVTINFGTNVIQSFTFTYGSTTAFPDPAYQHFAMHDISFTPVPEVNPTVMSVFSCLVAAGLVFRHRFRLRK